MEMEEEEFSRLRRVVVHMRTFGGESAKPLEIRGQGMVQILRPWLKTNWNISQHLSLSLYVFWIILFIFALKN